MTHPQCGQTLEALPPSGTYRPTEWRASPFRWRYPVARAPCCPHTRDRAVQPATGHQNATRFSAYAAMLPGHTKGKPPSGRHTQVHRGALVTFRTSYLVARVLPPMGTHHLRDAEVPPSGAPRSFAGATQWHEQKHHLRDAEVPPSGEHRSLAGATQWHEHGAAQSQRKHMQHASRADQHGRFCAFAALLPDNTRELPRGRHTQTATKWHPSATKWHPSRYQVATRTLMKGYTRAGASS